MKKFLCDQMCVELGKWLRAAGYDTAIIDESMPDEEIFKKAQNEDRFVLTRDKDFKILDPEGKKVIYLNTDDLDEWASQLSEHGLTWLYKPFTRCLACNAIFDEAPPPQPSEEIPSDANQFWTCPKCHHLFWRGSHTENMEKQLRAWDRGAL